MALCHAISSTAPAELQCELTCNTSPVALDRFAIELNRNSRLSPAQLHTQTEFAPEPIMLPDDSELHPWP